MLGSLQQTRSPLSTVVARDGESVLCVSSLIVQIVRHAEEFALLGGPSLELPKNLVVALAAHDDLAVDVLDVHVLPAVGIGAHQARLVGDTGLDVVYCRGLRRLLQ